MEKIYCQILFFLALQLSVWQFQMPLEGLIIFVKMLATFGIINATDTLGIEYYKDSLSLLIHL